MKPAFTKDAANHTMVVTKTVAAPRNQVWKAWTTSELLDQWWGPKPWNAITQKMEFIPGGKWLYYMQGPDGTKSWATVEYKSIEPEKSFSGLDAFADEAGNINMELPRTDWRVEFTDQGDNTDMTVTMKFADEAAMQKIIDMGFEEGFTIGLDQLDELLAMK